MKKIIILLFAIITAYGSIKAKAEGIEFEKGDWASVKAAAKANHKVIFIDFYTDWCAPCKVMAQTIFPLKDVGDFYNKNFVCVQINAEKGEGIALRKKYSIGAYPTMMFTNDQEEIVYRAIGSSSAGEFIDQGKIALRAPSEEFAQLKSKYLKDELTKEELYKYYLHVKAQSNYKETKAVFDKYFAVAANVSLDMFQTITSGVSDPNSKAFLYLQDHQDEFSKVAGKEKVDSYIRETLIRDVEFNSYVNNGEYLAAKEGLKKKINLSEKEELHLDANYYCEVKDKDRYMAASTKLADKYLQNDDLGLSNQIGGSMRFNLNQDELLIVKSWAERALAIKDNALNNATLAMVYKNLKNKEQALKYINRSLAVCERDHETYTSRVEMFKKEIENADYQAH